MTKVVNKKTYQGTDGFYIGRPTIWGNPWSHLDVKDTVKVSTRNEACDNHLNWLLGTDFQDFEQDQRKQILDSLELLRGETLLCWCRPKRCHGENYIRLLNES